MSHIVTIETKVLDADAVMRACHRLDLPVPQLGTFELFADTVSGLGIFLPNWKYPVVCDLKRGELRYDNYAGHWGDGAQLDRFLQAYAIEKARLEARKLGHTVTEQQLSDGSVKLTIQQGASSCK